MTQSVYHVIHRDGDWHVEYEGRTLSSHGTQPAAELRAREHARARMPSRVVVTAADGQVEEDVTYRDDFDPPRA